MYYRDGGIYIDGQLRFWRYFNIVVFRFVALTNYEKLGVSHPTEIRWSLWHYVLISLSLKRFKALPQLLVNDFFQQINQL